MNKDDINEAIILVGGLGTRLKSIVNDVPKVLAPVAGRPFLEHLLDHLIDNGIEKVIFAVGYKHELIIEHFKNSYKNLKISYAIENEPLGTGGGIVNALDRATKQKLLVLNGDVFCSFKIEDLISDVQLQITAIELEDVSRYGYLKILGDELIAFSEKDKTGKGFINAGIYLIDKDIFKSYSKGDKFSFEYDFMPEFLKNQKANVRLIPKKIFIDIGTPEDYKKAQELLANK